MKRDGEVSLNSKSRLSTGSAQPLLIAGFEIKHWNFLQKIHRAPPHHSLLPRSKRQVKNKSPEPGNSLLLK